MNRLNILSTSATTMPVMIPHSTSNQLEKVKLPSFSGTLEDYTEFKFQFHELCNLEHVPEVMQLAQLRTKIPATVMAMLVGIKDLNKAWKTPDDQFGDTHLAIISAISWLQAFKPSSTILHQ